MPGDLHGVGDRDWGSGAQAGVAARPAADRADRADAQGGAAVRQAGRGCRGGHLRTAGDRPADAGHGGADQTGYAGAGVLPAGAHRHRRHALPGLEIPDHASRCVGLGPSRADSGNAARRRAAGRPRRHRRRPDLQAGERRPRDPGGTLAQADLGGRAGTAVQRAPGGDEPGRPAAAAAVRAGGLRSLAVRPAAGQTGNHRALAGLGAQPADLSPDVRAGRGVRAALVAGAGSENPSAHAAGGAVQLRAGGLASGGGATMKTRAVRVGVIGCGYWGPNLVRNFARHTGSQVQAVCDRQFERAARVGAEYRIPVITDRHEEVLEARDLDLVIIATPSFSHFELARQALQAGKHVLVMKPLTTRLDHAEELCDLAERNGVLLAVDHTFVFTGAVRRMRELIVGREIGELYYFDSVRINLGLIQTDVNVIWDLAPHDVSIMDYLIARAPVSVAATGASHGGSPTENMAYVTVRYTGSLIGHVHVNWLAAAKVGRPIPGGPKKKVIDDHIESTHPRHTHH